jgi:broad specificity phosphatase PhoE
MQLYLIRHGITDAHLNKIRQSADTPLGKHGLQQAKAVAKRLKNIKFDYLYSSNWPRALQTAQEIAKEINMEIKLHPLIHENLKHPSLNDIPEDSQINQRFVQERKDNWYNFDWKFDGEGESVNDLIQRAQKVINYLVQTHPSDDVAIVSHSYFMAILTGVMILGPETDRDVIMRLVRSLEVTNTGVSKFIYYPDSQIWRLIYHNDHHHLESPKTVKICYI